MRLLQTLLIHGRLLLTLDRTLSVASMAPLGLEAHYLRVQIFRPRHLILIISPSFHLWPHSPLTRIQSADTLGMLPRMHPTATRNHWESQSIYLRHFISTDTAPTPVGHIVTGYEPPMTIDFMRERFSPEYRHFATQASLRSAFLNTHISDSVSRFGDELRHLFDPHQVAHPEEPSETTRQSSLPSFVTGSSVSSNDSPVSYRMG